MFQTTNQIYISCFRVGHSSRQDILKIDQPRKEETVRLTICCPLQAGQNKYIASGWLCDHSKHLRYWWNLMIACNICTNPFSLWLNVPQILKTTVHLQFSENLRCLFFGGVSNRGRDYHNPAFQAKKGFTITISDPVLTCHSRFVKAPRRMAPGTRCGLSKCRAPLETGIMAVTRIDDVGGILFAMPTNTSPI